MAPNELFEQNRRFDQYRVPWQNTCWTCGLENFSFQCTDELVPLDHFIGQQRALESLRFGLEVEKPGYNLFVTGLTGTGKTTAIKEHLQNLIGEMARLEKLKPIYDWCYVHNFEEPDRPRALRLSRGLARPLRQRLSRILTTLKEQVPLVFKSDEYQSQLREHEEAGRQATQQVMARLEQSAQAEDFALQVTPAGVSIFPKQNGRPMTPEEYQELETEAKTSIDEKRIRLMQLTQDTMASIRDLEKETSDQVQTLERVVANERVCDVFQELMDSYRDQPRNLGIFDPSYRLRAGQSLSSKRRNLPQRPSCPWARRPSAAARPTLSCLLKSTSWSTKAPLRPCPSSSSPIPTGEISLVA